MARWPLVLLWFSAQLIWNLTTKQHDMDRGEAVLLLQAFGQMTSPVEIIATIIAMVAIKKRVWERKSLAERQREKYEGLRGPKAD